LSQARERSNGAQTNGVVAYGKTDGSDTRCWCQAVGGEIDPTGSISRQAGSDGDKTNSLAEESAV
jgi:hypothetical protein